jgi:transposase
LCILWVQKVQKTSTAEFKREAIQLAQTSGKPIAQVARELGISDTSIHQWRKELCEHSREAFPGSGHQTAQEEELRRLKRELERTQKERDIVKKSHIESLNDELIRRKLKLLARFSSRPRRLMLPHAMLPV